MSTRELLEATLKDIQEKLEVTIDYADATRREIYIVSQDKELSQERRQLEASLLGTETTVIILGIVEELTARALRRLNNPEKKEQ